MKFSYQKNNKRQLVFADEGYIQLAGKTKSDEILKLKETDYLPAGIAGSFRREDQKVLKSGRYSIQNIHLEQNGFNGYYEILRTPIYDENGKICGLMAVARKIAESFKSTEETKEYAERFMQVFQFSPDAIFIVDPDNGRILDANDTAIKRMGYTRKELLRLKVDDMNAPNQSSSSVVIKKALASDEYVFERIHLTKKGVKIPVEVKTITGAMFGKKVLVFVVRDMAERKQADEEKNHYRNMLNEAQKISHLGSWELDLIANKLVWSDEIYNIFELDKDNFEASYETFLEHVHPEDRELVNKAFVNSVKNKTEYEVTHRLRMPDGRIKYVLERGHSDYNKKGKAIRTLGTVQDITERVEAQLALERVEKRLVLATKAAVIGVWEWDLVNDVLEWDESMYQLYGQKPEYFSGAYDAWSSSLTPDQREETEQKFRECVKNKSDYDSYFKITWPDGSLHFIKAHAKLEMDKNGVPVRIVGVNYDITDQKVIESELKATNQVLNSILDNIPNFIFLKETTKLKYTLVNKAVEELIGLRREKILGKTDKDFFPKKEAAMYISRDRQAIETREIVETPEEIMNLPDGRHILHTKKIILHDDDGNPQYILGISEDITEKIRHEKLRQEAVQRFFSAFDSSAIGMALVSPEGNFMDANTALSKIVGYSREELMQKTFQDITHPDDLEADLENAMKLAAGEISSYQMEKRYLHKDGHVVWILLTGSSVRDEQNRLMYFIAQIQDISHKKKSEQEFSELFDFNQKIIYQSTLGILVYTGEGDCVLANEAAAKIVGAAREQLTHQNFRKISTWKTSGLLDAALLALKTGEIQHVESGMQTTFGKNIWADCDFIRLTRGGKPHLLLIINDVTQFKVVEKELSRAKDDADSANRAKSEFLANMSHEIRTPMNAILGLTDLALNSGEATSRLKGYLTRMHSSSMALLSIINDILDYSKIEAGHLDLEFMTVCLSDIIDKVADLFSIRVEEKNLELIVKIDPEIPEFLTGDALRIGQILNNLVGNAVKFTEEGEIMIALDLLERRDNLCVIRFKVKDTGIGLNQEQTGRLFQAFTQADSSITRRFGGTGLGLAISQRLIQKMGGEISVLSEPGKGSTFSFILNLPVETEKPSSRLKDSLPVTPFSGTHALVVDDLASSRMVISELLQKIKCQVTEAASGDKALKIIREHGRSGKKFDLIILDWQMPRMDGLTVMERIQKMETAGEISRTPLVIMVTAYAHDKLTAKITGPGPDAILIKPVTISRLAETVTEIFDIELSQKSSSGTVDVYNMPNPIRGARILLVEDNETNRLVAGDMLINMGFRLSAANNGKEAIEMLEKENFDGVLMDVQMPVMDGYQATKYLRKQEKFKNLPVIAMTAAVLERDKEACLSAGMNDHIAKPIQPIELRQALIRWIKIKNNPSVISEQNGDPEFSKTITAPMDASMLIQSLPDIDVAGALNRLNQNISLYVNLMEGLTGKFSKMKEDITVYLKTNNAKALSSLLHQLKGAAANLGIVNLVREIETQEKAIDNKKKATSKKLFAQLDSTMRSIHKLDRNSESTFHLVDCDKCDTERIHRALNRIMEKLETYEFITHQDMELLKLSIRCEDLQNFVNQLEELIGNMEFTKAIDLIKHIPCEGNPYYEKL